MALQTKITPLILALLLALSACTKQDEPPKPDPASPTGTTQQAPMSAADCDRLPDPRPIDDSAAGRARAVSEGMAAREACKKAAAVTPQDKANADLARIRQIKEKEQADQAARRMTEQEWGQRINESSGKPIKEYKY
jgi:hypothetical protein